MKATGVSRKIDELGRIVIPKEIRRTLRIREGTPLEIFTDDEGQIILRKYSPIGEWSEFANQCAEAVSQNTGNISIITDRDQVIAVSGTAKKNLIHKPITKELENVISSRKIFKGTKDNLPLVDGDKSDIEKTWQVVQPVLCEGDVIGSVILRARDTKRMITDADLGIAAVAAGFLSKQMEN